MCLLDSLLTLPLWQIASVSIHIFDMQVKLFVPAETAVCYQYLRNDSILLWKIMVMQMQMTFSTLARLTVPILNPVSYPQHCLLPLPLCMTCVKFDKFYNVG